jgi:beta-lactamase regulating signal transducer with metallopeptidase domain
MNVEIYNRIAELFNYFEIGLWFLFGIAMILQSQTMGEAYRKVLYASAVAFFAFSVSDYIEIQTGAWWTPWWLFILKALCVITFVVCLVLFLKIKKSQSRLND